MNLKTAWPLPAALLLLAAVALWPRGHARMRHTRPITASPSARELARQADPAAAHEPAAREPGDAADTDELPAAGASAIAAEDLLRGRSTEALLERLDSDDQYVQLDAADGLRARKATQAIPKLARIDVVERPDSARTVIDALGKLAGMARGDERKVAVDRLQGLLSQERTRERADAPGNVLQIYEALGYTDDDRSAATLEAELADPEVPLAALAEVIASLVRLGRASSIPALAAARERIAKLSFDEEFEREVQADILARLGAALVELESSAGAAR